MRVTAAVPVEDVDPVSAAGQTVVGKTSTEGQAASWIPMQ